MLGGHGKPQFPKPLQRNLSLFCCLGFKHTQKVASGETECSL